MNPNEFYDVKEAAEVLRLQVPTLRAWLRRGVLPHVKISPKKILIKREDVKAFIEKASR